MQESFCTAVVIYETSLRGFSITTAHGCRKCASFYSIKTRIALNVCTRASVSVINDEQE